MEKNCGVSFLQSKCASALFWFLMIGILGGCRHETVFANSEPGLIGPPIFTEDDRRTGHGAAGTTHPDSSLQVSPTIRHSMRDDSATAGLKGCRPQDRLDREGTLAYQFGEDEKSRLALHMSIDGPSFSNPARFEVEKIALRYTFKFQEHKNKKERCLYPSRYQGLIGSTYHELYNRDEGDRNAFEAMYDQAIQEVEDRGLDFWH